MRVPLSWLGEYVDIAGLRPGEIAERLTAAGLQVERLEELGGDIRNVVVARVLTLDELAGFKKPLRWVSLTDGANEHQVICGATNFAVGDLVAYARPPAVLPGGFVIEQRKAYGHLSDGMICSARELGIGDDHTGILVLATVDSDASLPLGADVVDALHLRDTVFDIAVNPDRGYALSMRGVAREVATAFRLGFADPALSEPARADAAGDPAWQVSIEDKDGCDRYLLRSVSGLDPRAQSPQWLRRRIALAGMRPISLTVDVTNYVMLAVGQPLHAFDATKVAGGIVVRRAVPGERLRTLDEVDRRLDPSDLVIADDTGAIALAGVMGGATTEIDADTTSVLLEAAHFDPISVACTSRRHRLGSEASRRFERGVDDTLPSVAAGLACSLLGSFGGTRDDRATGEVDLRSAPRAIVLAADLPGRLAGVDYPPETVLERLADVGCSTEPEPDGHILRVQPPPWRPDLQRPVDLVEEIVRLEGYAGLPVTVPRAPAGRGLTRGQRQRRTISRAVAAAGYAEVLSQPFVAEATSEALSFGPDDARRPVVRLANPVSDEQPWMRGSLLPGLLDALLRNVNRGFTDVALFETGPVFRRPSASAAMPRPPAGQRPSDADLQAMQAALPDQPLHLATALAGSWERPGWWGPGRPVGWADAVQSAIAAAAAVGVNLTTRSSTTTAPWHTGRCAELLIDGAVVGHAGELHPRVVQALGLPARSCAMEMTLDLVLAAAPELPKPVVVSAYPAATLDVAVVVADNVPLDDVRAALVAGAGGLLENIRLFDVYRGDPVEAGHVSYAFALQLRAADRTLTAEEAAAVRDSAVAVAAEQVGARLRT